MECLSLTSRRQALNTFEIPLPYTINAVGLDEHALAVIDLIEWFCREEPIQPIIELQLDQVGEYEWGMFSEHISCVLFESLSSEGNNGRDALSHLSQALDVLLKEESVEAHLNLKLKFSDADTAMRFRLTWPVSWPPLPLTKTD